MPHCTRTLLALTVLLAGATAHADTLTVDPTDKKAYATIADAVAAAQDGDDIEVVAGKYVENVDFGGLDLTLTGLDGSGATTIMGGVDLAGCSGVPCLVPRCSRIRTSRPVLWSGECRAVVAP